MARGMRDNSQHRRHFGCGPFFIPTVKQMTLLARGGRRFVRSLLCYFGQVVERSLSPARRVISAALSISSTTSQARQDWLCHLAVSRDTLDTDKVTQAGSVVGNAR